LLHLNIAGARVVVVNDLRVGFLGQWWHVVAEAEEFPMLVVVGIELVGFGNVAGWGVEVVLVVRLLE
jgi:hypothetical protein